MLSSGRFSILIIAIVAGIVWPTAPVHGQAKRRNPQPSTATQRHALAPREIAAKVSRSLVLIVTQDKDGQPLSSGSGFFYNTRAAHDPRLPPGVEFVPEEIATSLHVFKRASQGYVKLLGEGVSYRPRSYQGLLGLSQRMTHTMKRGQKARIGNQPLLEGMRNSIPATQRKNEFLTPIDSAVASVHTAIRRAPHT